MNRFLSGLALAAALLVAPPASATTHLVRADGSGDFPNIAGAVAGATAGDTISLANGTFTGSANKNLDFGGKQLVVRSQSGVPDACILDCQGSGRGFIFQSGEDSTSVLDAFTITGGILDYGSAIYCRAGSGPRISGCILVDNDRDYYATGHGVLTCVEASHPRILDCQFLDNHAQSGGTVYVNSGSSPRIDQCTFSRNYGVALYARDSELTVTRCLFSKNFSSAMSFQYSSPVVTGSTVVGHWYGPVDVFHGAPQFIDCTIASNNGSYDSAISISYANVTLSNTIIAHNAGKDAVGCFQSQVGLTCCDLFGNERGNWTDCIAGQYGVDGNISGDPLFCDAANGEFTLAENSPCAPDGNLVCGLIGAWPVNCPPACTIALTPGRIVTYDRCEGSFRVDLSVDHVVKLGSFDLCLGFKGADVSFDHVVVDSEFLGSTGRFVQPTAPSPCAADCQTDGINLGANTVGAQPGPSGAGRLATIFWRPAPVESETESDLCFDATSFENTDAPPAAIPVATVRGTTLVHRKYCYGDFNDNGDVSIVDVMQVAARWGSELGDGTYIYDENFDVNLIEPGNYCASIPDSSIDVVDVQAVAARWGQGCPGATPAAPPGEFSRSGVTVSEPSTWLRILPELVPITGEIGDTGVFTVEVEDAQALGAFQATLVFDPAIIHVEAVEPAEFLGSTGRSVYTLEPRIDNESGVVTLGAWSLGTTAGPEGSGSLARVTVSLRSCPGSSAVEISRAMVTDTNGWPHSLAGVAGGTVVTECSNPSSSPYPASASLKLLPSRPNPFARTTTIPFVIPTSAGSGVPIELLIVDVSGRTVRRLASGSREPGYHEVTWDGRDDRGIAAPGGVYFCRLRAGETRLRKQLILLD